MHATTAWQLAGPKTFRRGSRALFKYRSSFKGYGTNLQNQSPTNSQCYVASKGKLIIQADQSGAEALRVAYLCRPGNYRDLFTNKIKPHVFIGLSFPQHWEHDYPQIRRLAKLTIPALKQDPEWKELADAIKDSDNNPPKTRFYYIYKQACHSGNYDVTAPTFRLNTLQKSDGAISLSLPEAHAYINNYHFLFPEIREWQAEVRKQIEETRYLFNGFGHPRYFSGVFCDKLFKEAFAHDPQSTIGTITCNAYCAMQEFIEESGVDWDLLPDKHDSIAVQAPEDEALIAASILRSSLEQTLAGRDGVKFTMRSEVSVGRNWGKYNAEKNPEGLKEVVF
jgi:DNA polymerase family A